MIFIVFIFFPKTCGFLADSRLRLRAAYSSCFNFFISPFVYILKLTDYISIFWKEIVLLNDIDRLLPYFFSKLVDSCLKDKVPGKKLSLEFLQIIQYEIPR